MQGTVEAFVQRIHQDIPLTQSMQWHVQSIHADRLIATAPLAPNINDKGTFFGGASSALMTISAWSLIKFNLEQLDMSNDVVIQGSENRWIRPQSDDMRIVCEADDSIDWRAIKTTIQQSNKTHHLTVHCKAQSDQKTTCTMQANYVILPLR